MTKAELLARIDAAIAKGRATLASANPLTGPGLPPNYDPEHSWVKPDTAMGFRTAALSILHSLYGPDHRFYRDFDEGTHGKHTLQSWRGPLALMEAIREEVDNGWIENVRALIAADVFSDILEMADYLLSEGYKDAAAVLVGGSLEGHLRRLSTRHGIATQAPNASGVMKSAKAELLNQELHKAGAYSLGDQKQVTAWLNLRNDAAHAHYGNYAVDQVRLMQQGVQNFIVRIPA